MDKVQAMAVFVEIAERGSLTAAANALDLSLPSVVRVLAALEAALGVRLFNRSTRRVSITAEGRVYLEHCRRIRAAIDEADQAMSQARSEPSGLITLTAPVRFGEMHVAPLVARFLAGHPRVEVRLLLLDRIVDLLDEGVDMAVRIAPVPDTNLVARPVGELRRIVCASPELIARHGLPLKPQDLARLPCLRFSGLGELSSWRFGSGRKTIEVQIDGQWQSNNAGASVSACIDGLGFGRFLCYQAMPAVREGRLDIVLEDFEPERSPLTLVYPQNRSHTARMRLFIDCMTRGLKQALAG